jgi:hypothetical protein
MKHKVHIVHQTPGRVRLKVPGARNNAAMLEEIRQAFMAIPGIEEVNVNPTTGSVVLYYDQEQRDGFHAHFAQHTAAPTPHNGTPPTTEIDSLANKIEEEAEFLAAHSHLARGVVDFCKSADRQLRQSTNNVIDLKIFIAVGLVAITFLEVGASAATPMWVTVAIFALNHYLETHQTTASASQAVT